MPSRTSELRRPNPAPLRLLLASLLCLLLPALASPAEETSQETTKRSPTVAGLLELLEAEMTEDVMLLWLDTRETEPAPPSAADLLDLRDAGASDAVLGKLLRLAAGMNELTSEPPASGVSNLDESTPPEPAVPGFTASRPAVSEPTDSEAPVSEPTVSEPGDTIVDFTLSYVPEFRSDEKEWDLYVYLDGKPLSFVSRGSRVLGGDKIEFQQALEAGPHQIRIVQENHEADDAESVEGHFHEARVAPVDLFFRLEPGDAEVEISYERPLLEFRSGGPIAFRVAQAGRVLIAQDEAGDDPDGWTPICDDAEVGGESPPRGCRNWATFWTVDAPPRHEVLRALSLFDYRPVPKNQRVH